MKKILRIALVILCLISLCGCQRSKQPVDDQIVFYYPRLNLNYGQEDAVISSELRDIENRANDISYVIRLYLNGPVSDELYSPFYSDTTLFGAERVDNTLYITLGGKEINQKSQLQFTIACACLAKTCFSLTDVSEIHINTLIRENSGLSAIVFDNENLILWDDAYLTADSTENPAN
jgi:hypothetical protein